MREGERKGGGEGRRKGRRGDRDFSGKVLRQDYCLHSVKVLLLLD